MTDRLALVAALADTLIPALDDAGDDERRRSAAAPHPISASAACSRPR